MFHRIASPAILALSFVTILPACSGGSSAQSGSVESPADKASGADEASKSGGASDGAASDKAAQPAQGDATPAASGAQKKEPATVDDCKAVAAESTGVDPAAPTEVTGQSDRRDALGELMKTKRPGFRCCFDLWAGKIPDVKLYTKVKFVLEIDPSGKLKKAEAGPEEGGPMVSQEVGSCLSDVAASLTWPASPTGKVATYIHHFDFKPKRR